MSIIFRTRVTLERRNRIVVVAERLFDAEIHFDGLRFIVFQELLKMMKEVAILQLDVDSERRLFARTTLYILA